jgi:hypothetical protein
LAIADDDEPRRVAAAAVLDGPEIAQRVIELLLDPTLRQ